MKHPHLLEDKTPAQSVAGVNAAAYSLENHGLCNLRSVYWNLSEEDLNEEAVFRGEGQNAANDSFEVDAEFDSRPAINDRFVVREPETENQIWWGENNRPFLTRKFSAIHQRVQAYLQGRDLFVRDCYAGDDERYRLPVRIITEYAWQSLYARNLLVQPDSPDEMRQFVPEFNIISVPGFEASPMIDSTMSEKFILLNLEQRLCLIGGSGCRDEIRDSISKVMNHLLSRENVLTLHCLANIGSDDKRDAALFLGLPGSGRTALTGGENRETIADGGLGWSGEGVFGFESGIANHPKHIFMLTCDATGVLPPIARLTPEQAAYYFVSGYSSIVGDNTTDEGKPPVTTFSPCYASSLIVRHPWFYAEQLKNKTRKHDVTCWLVNTGWMGGASDSGERISGDVTNTLLNAALRGELSGVEYTTDEVFGFEIPKSCGGVSDGILNPVDSWESSASFEEKRVCLAALFVENFKKYADDCPPETTETGPGKE